MKTSSAKAKGRRLQAWVRDRVLDTFSGLSGDDVVSRSTSAPGEDIIFSKLARSLVPFSIECKMTEKFNAMKAYEQALSNAADHMPVVVWSRNRNLVPLAVIAFDDLLILLDRLALAKDRV